MTIEERLARIEHITAGLDERQRKDHEEDRELWRETQRQIASLTANLDRYAAESLAADERLGQRIEELAAQSRAADQALGERIGALVSSIGVFISREKQQ